MLSTGMAIASAARRPGKTTPLALLAMLMVSACASVAPEETASVCPKMFVTFVGFEEGVGTVRQNGSLLWQGRIARYDPSTDISASAELCATGGSEMVAEALGKTYRARLPTDASPYFVLIDARTEEPLIQKRPFLLD